jgi:hypothetical protein
MPDFLHADREPALTILPYDQGEHPVHELELHLGRFIFYNEKTHDDHNHY